MPFDRFRFLNDSGDDQAWSQVTVTDAGGAVATSQLPADPPNGAHLEQAPAELTQGPNWDAGRIVNVHVTADAPAWGVHFDDPFSVPAAAAFYVQWVDAQIVRLGESQWEYRRCIGYLDVATNQVVCASWAQQWRPPPPPVPPPLPVPPPAAAPPPPRARP